MNKKAVKRLYYRYYPLTNEESGDVTYLIEYTYQGKVWTVQEILYYKGSDSYEFVSSSNGVVVNHSTEEISLSTVKVYRELNWKQGL